MSVYVAAIATESGVPLFIRKRGVCDGIQFSTMASLHGINIFSKCHDVTILETIVPNGSLLCKEFNNSVTLIGITTGGLESQLPLLLSSTYDAMVLAVGRPDLDSLKNTEQVKRDLRACLPLVDCLLESLDPSVVSRNQHNMFLEFSECLLCPEAAQLQRAADNYCRQTGGRWACVSVHGRLVATSGDWGQLDSREARLLLLMSSQPGAPLKEQLVYLPYTSPSVAFRCITCKLLSDVYVLIICGATPALSQLDAAALRCWESSAQSLRDARSHTASLPSTISLPPQVKGVLIVNTDENKCAYHASALQKSAAQRLHALRTFYVTCASALLPATPATLATAADESLPCETYCSSQSHICHARRLHSLLCCVMYTSSVNLHTARVITTQILTDIAASKDIFW